MDASPSRGYRPALILALILLLGLGLRLIRLDFQPLWWDEGYTVWFVSQPLGAMARLTAADIHPPLYYALVHVWSQFAGFSPRSLRLASILLALPAIPLAYALGRDLRDQTTGYLAAFLVAVNPMAVYYSQEIRMYGLAATLSLAALWTGWRWGMMRDERPSFRWAWGVGYALSLIAGLYTLYVFILLPVAQFLWMLLFRRERWKPFVGTLFAAALAYLPWVFLAGPQLLAYVPNKVVKDNDQPLPLLIYLGRHLSAFTIGHLEGAYQHLWPWALLLWIPPGLALAVGWRNYRREAGPSRYPLALAYLGLVLLVALTGGFLQQIRAPFIPEHFERVLFFAAPALWLLLALGVRILWRESRLAGGLFLVLLLTIQAASLVGFYTIPRYAQRDYRPLIRTVSRQLRPGDSIFAIYPWQAGYFLAYLPQDQHPTLIPPGTPLPDDVDLTPIVLSPDPDWSHAVAQTLTQLQARGGIWLPEHLSLGGIFESKVETYLGQHSYQLLNRWFGAETRLTGWDEPRRSDEAMPLVVPLAWENDVRLVQGVYRLERGRLFFDLAWEGNAALDPSRLVFSLWLRGADGQRWAQRDVTPFAHPWPPLPSDAAPWRNEDRIGLTLPAGTPPGDYELFLALLWRDLTPISVVGANPTPEAWAATLALNALPPILPHPQHPQHRTSPQLDFLGADRALIPYLPGDDLPVALYWLPHGPLQPDHFLFLQLLDDKQQLRAGMEGPPIAWLPTSAWDDASLRTQHRLRVPADLPPGSYTLITGLFDPASGQRVVWQGREDAIELGKVTIAPREHDFQPPAPQHPLQLTLQGGHRLVGYDLIGRAEPGSPINLILYWRPAGPTQTRYSVFVHLIDHDGRILAQDDGEPAEGRHPTTSWLAGETIADFHAFPFPQTDSPGPFGLEIGLYDPLTGARVPFVDEQGQILADHIVIPLE